MKREQVSKKKAVARRPDTSAEQSKAPNAEVLKSDLDALLDEVDSVLETNAEEFVAQYIQKGGELHGAWHPRFLADTGTCPQGRLRQAMAKAEC